MVKDSLRTIAIVVAAGSGSRYGGDVPKQFLELDGMPVLAHSVFAFSKVFPECELFIVLSADGVWRWNDFCRSRSDVPQHTVVEGGATRTDSVANAVKAAAKLPHFGSSVIMVHDGARPMIGRDLLVALHSESAKGHASAPALEISDSMVEFRNDDITCVRRDRFRTVQTPQVFPGDALAEAFGRYESDTTPPSLTDDISLVRHYVPELPVALVPGSRSNLKITRRGDLELALFYLAHPLC